MGEEILLPLEILSKCQPEFVYENQVENGKITAWFSKEKTKEAYKTWMNNRPKK